MWSALTQRQQATQSLPICRMFNWIYCAPAKPPSPIDVLTSAETHIALRYPGWPEFIPLFLPLQPFPGFSRRLVRLFTPKSADVGGYCSQMVSQMLRALYGVSVGTLDDHVSPGRLRRRLLKTADVTAVNCFAPSCVETWEKSDKLAKIYDDLSAVTSKLKAYQYPHNRDSFVQALAQTFQQEAINSDPNAFAITHENLKRTLTKPQFFLLHEVVWSSKYT
jgi:hypothetical protein